MHQSTVFVPHTCVVRQAPGYKSFLKFCFVLFLRVTLLSLCGRVLYLKRKVSRTRVYPSVIYPKPTTLNWVFALLSVSKQPVYIVLFVQERQRTYRFLPFDLRIQVHVGLQPMKWGRGLKKCSVFQSCRHKERLMFSCCDMHLSDCLSVVQPSPPKKDFWAAHAISSNFNLKKNNHFFLHPKIIFTQFF